MITLDAVRTAVTRTACRSADRSSTQAARFAGVPDQTNPDAVTIVLGDHTMSFVSFVETAHRMYPDAPFIVASTFGRILHAAPGEDLASFPAENVTQRPDAPFGVVTVVLEDGRLAVWATLRSVADDGTTSWRDPYEVKFDEAIGGLASLTRRPDAAAGN